MPAEQERSIFGALFGDAFAVIDSARDTAMRWGYRPLVNAVGRCPGWLSSLPRMGATARAVPLMIILSFVLTLSDARLRGGPLPLFDPGSVLGFIVTGTRDLPAAFARDLFLVVSCAIVCHVLAAVLGRAMGELVPVLARVAVLALALPCLLAFADARLRGRPLPSFDPGSVLGFVVAGVRDLPTLEVSLLPAAFGRDPVLVMVCALALLTSIALVKALFHTFDIGVALVWGHTVALLALALFVVVATLTTPVVLGIATTRVIARRRWIVAGGRLDLVRNEVPARLVAIAAALLPAAYQKDYAERFESELYDLTLVEGVRWRHLLAHSLRVLIRVGHLNAALRSSQERASS
ncbi:hypothetical protein ACIBEJ_20465 [Nonomuraea sp. NPDC050790]|uniref:hypothetical protein n=1 Tax=Nonomuraea sp. NPDC050790 TaxID=3364371 RepID=UPI0037AF3B40